MPKKLPLYWPDDSNCNKVPSRTLRVLRDRPNKLNSGPRTIQSLCDSYKAKHFKSEKLEKLRAIEDFHGFLSSEALLSRHSKNRSRPRQLLEVNKQRLETFQNLNSTWKKKYSNAMAVDFDHMYIDCGDSKISIGRDIEFQHLKQLNLLHLDLIQQQTEQLISKDKIIKSLKDENKNLRSRLERIDRRVTLSHQKKTLSPISVQTDFSDDATFPFAVKAESPKLLLNKSPSRSPTIRTVPEKPQVKTLIEESLIQGEILPSKKESLRRHSPKHIISNSTISPVPHVSRLSPREKRAKKESTTIVTEFPLTNNVANEIAPPLSPSQFDIKKTRSLTSKRSSIDESLVPNKKNKSEAEEEEEELIPLNATQDEGITDHSLRSRDKSHEETIQNNIPKLSDSNLQTVQVVSNSSQISNEKQNSMIPVNNFLALESEKMKPTFKAGVEMCKIRGEGILTTTDSYYLPSCTSIDFFEDSIDDDQTQVEIPKWRIKVLTSLYVMEGTENLEDEIFVKRHAKPEHEERRRKRWDLQRMREQRQYEKLRERYEGRNNPNGSCCGNDSSLWPNPDNAQALQVDKYLPVCAFGQPLAQISESDFFVPWLTGKVPLQVGIATRRKKR